MDPNMKSWQRREEKTAGYRYFLNPNPPTSPYSTLEIPKLSDEEVNGIDDKV
jgi:hypothetical protein